MTAEASKLADPKPSGLTSELAQEVAAARLLCVRCAAGLVSLDGCRGCGAPFDVAAPDALCTSCGEALAAPGRTRCAPCGERYFQALVVVLAVAAIVALVGLFGR